MLRSLTLFAFVHLGSSMSFGSERPIEAGLHAGLEASTPRLRVADADGYPVVKDVDQLVIGQPCDFRQSAASDLVAIAAGGSHTLALKKDGSVIGWGRHWVNPTRIPFAAQSGVEAIAAGGSYSFALKRGGKVIAWVGGVEVEVPSAAEHGVVAIAAGESHTLALKQDGSVIGWGKVYDGSSLIPLTVPAEAASGVVAIAAGGAQSIVLKADGNIVTWGFAYRGRRVVPFSPVPVTFPDSLQGDIVAIAAGKHHAVAQKRDGRLIAWGHVQTDAGMRPATIPEAAQSGVVSFAAGWEHTVALKRDGSVIAWGFNRFGESTLPPEAQTDAVAVAAGHYHTAVLKRDGSVVAWGDQSTAPKGPEDGVIAISTGGGYLAAMKKDGSIVTWGVDLATGPDAGLSGVVAVSAGGSHTVALKESGQVIAWGLNEHGECDVPASARRDVVAIAAGSTHTQALKGDGTLMVWGELWDGSKYYRARMPNFAKSGIAAVAANWAYTLALKRNGSVVAWGLNDVGQTSVPPAAKRGVVAIAAGQGHALALNQDGRVIAWGYEGATNVPAAAESGVKAIAAGGFHSLALKNDDSVIGWGDNSRGQTTIPEAAQGNAVGIAAGGEFTALLVRRPGNLGNIQPRTIRSQILLLHSSGTAPLASLRAVIEGRDADQFSISTVVPSGLPEDAHAPLSLVFQPNRVGRCDATLKVYSDDPAGPFTLPLMGGGSFSLKATAASAASPLTYAALRREPRTGLTLQKITFANTTGTKLEGLKLILSNIAPRMEVYGSSLGLGTQTYEVFYSKPISAGETISFDLVYFDPLGRTTDSIQPTITAEALLEPEPDSLPVTGALVPLISAVRVPQGPYLVWNAVPNAVHVVEYSDDGGRSWFSAVHRIGTSGNRMFWIDRGQPETRTTPVGRPNAAGGRQYRVKRL